MRFKNVSNKWKRFKVNNKWKDVESGQEVDLPGDNVHLAEEGLENLGPTEAELKSEAESKARRDEAALALGELEPDSVEEPTPMDDPIPKYSKSALKHLSEEEQFVLLRRYNVEEEELKSLNREGKRVRHLLKLQEEADEE